MEATHRENMSPRTSRARAPSKIPAFSSRGLNEISESETNARNAVDSQESSSLKHKPSHLPEPDAKRKTLAERAGEIPRGIPAAPPNSRPVSAYVRATAAAGVRNTSSSSSGSSRTASSISSHLHSGNALFTGSIGPGSTRPPSQSSYRQSSKPSHHRNAFSVSESRPVAPHAHLAGVDGHNILDKRKAWDTKSRLENMEQDMKQLYGLKEQIDAATSDRSNLQDQVTFQKLRITELEAMRSQLAGTNDSLRATNGDLQNTINELHSTNGSLRSKVGYFESQLETVTFDLEATQRKLRIEVDDLTRKHRGELEDLRDTHKREKESAKGEKESAVREAREEVEILIKAHKEQLAELERKLQGDLEEEKRGRQREVQELADELSRHRETAEKTGADRERESQSAKNELAQLQAMLDQERALNVGLRDKITESATQTATLESSMQAMKAKINFLESDSQAQSHAFGDLNKRMQEAITSAEEANAKLRAEETLRRKLHNQVQELKGNIRVFCRVRPPLEGDDEEIAEITYPDKEDESKEVVVMGPQQKSSLGNVTTSKNGFSFDRVFGPSSKNSEVFEEISQLVQSALDGYNVCIFCYGQTGSGKTYTMSSEDGMIPLAVNQIYATATSLTEKGWTYTMEGSFVEVYNENVNDLLGKADDIDKKKHEIRHDSQKSKTTITDVNTMTLDSPATLQSLLNRASKNRSVAATKANERSSRSHSVFILKLTGANHITGEQSEGVLNLVDLAGSERLAHSGATGDRLKETQNINRSLSCLGDVIAALGQGKEGAHIPYRNSKLTYLLQHSLGGNSKTLMFVMISPSMPHLSETLTSLKFATKVHNTHIGTAKRQAKVRDT